MDIITATEIVKREINRIRKINYNVNKVQEHHCIVL